jgi:Ala-tRNA(Pro) deacylase
LLLTAESTDCQAALPFPIASASNGINITPFILCILCLMGIDANVLFDVLDSNSISYKCLDHEPMLTMDDAQRKLGLTLRPDQDAKNLFLKSGSKTKKEFVLLMLPANKRVDLKGLASQLSVRKLQMGSAGEMTDLLSIGAGALSPLALLNDSDKLVKLVIDSQVWSGENGSSDNEDFIAMHPMVNTKTVLLRRSDFPKFLQVTGHVPTILDVAGSYELI